MRKLGYLLILPMFVMLGCSTSRDNIRPMVQPTTLDKQLVAKIKNSVFEVVVPKSEGDQITYEKPLPLDLIPYAIRTDKYYSIGTAFAVGPNEFLTASHVIELYLNSQYKDYYIRDNKGGIYKIDKILKYSSNRDFILFSVKSKKTFPVLETNDKPRMNENVYAVGNALGQGIIIRDGLYTSDTLEEEAGKWKWMRFSAAASPGNSGGPLLDEDGKVIGIVLRKSANENLNTALPFSEVLKIPDNTAVLHLKLKYLLENMDMTKIETLHETFSLPMSYEDLNKKMIKTTKSFSKGLLEKLLSENREEIFPRGKGSTQLLNSTMEAVFPNLVMKESDGNWGLFHPSEIKGAELGNNGYFKYGTMSNTTFIYMRKPDDIPLDKLYRDSSLFMDLLLKGIYLNRPVGSENIKITSLGKAHEDYSYTDSYNRKWLIKTWLLDYSDEKMVAFMLPVPGGLIAMLRLANTGIMDLSHIDDLKAFTEFTYLSYYGTLKEWKNFLKMKSFYPPIFSSIKIDSENGKYLKYKSKRLSFSYTSDLMEISEKSYLQLTFSYFKNSGNIVWDVSNIYAGEDKNKGTYFFLARNARPPKALNDNFHSLWNDITKKKFPYNMSPYYEDNSTYISTVISKKKRDIKYTLWHRKEGKEEENKMVNSLNKFMKNLQIYDEDKAHKKNI